MSNLKANFELDLMHVVRSVQSTEDLARLAFATLDELGIRYAREKDYDTARVVSDARTTLTHTLDPLWRKP